MKVTRMISPRSTSRVATRGGWVGLRGPCACRSKPTHNLVLPATSARPPHPLLTSLTTPCRYAWKHRSQNESISFIQMDCPLWLSLETILATRGTRDNRKGLSLRGQDYS